MGASWQEEEEGRVKGGGGDREMELGEGGIGVNRRGGEAVEVGPIQRAERVHVQRSTSEPHSMLFQNLDSRCR